MSASACFRRTTSLLLALVAAGLAGCAVQKGAALPALSDWEQRSRVLSEIDDFEFNGRIGVRTGDEGFNGKLRYTQDADAFNATVGGPLGVGTVRIVGNGRSAALTDKDGVTTELADVEIDLYLRYGWTIPVESLRYWALGIPQPGEPAETVFADTGELRKLTQRGWTVTISRYAEAAGQSMPSRLKAENAGTSVRLVIDRWIFH